jgi:two-component system LytT family response regulator
LVENSATDAGLSPRWWDKLDTARQGSVCSTRLLAPSEGRVVKVLLVDDEPLALARLQAAFTDIPGTEVVGTASDGEAALQAVSGLRPDLVILDMRMPLRNGLEVARALKDEAAPEVIFVTAFDEYAAEAFDVEAADYLLKPFHFDRLRIGVERARRRRTLRESGALVAELASEIEALRERPGPRPTDAYETEIWIPGSSGMTRVPVASIMWIEAARDYALLHTSVRSFILRETMGALEERLDPAVVMRVHRSAFVSPAAVRGFSRLGKGLIALTLVNDHVVPVGPSYTKAVLSALGARQEA